MPCHYYYCLQLFLLTLAALIYALSIAVASHYLYIDSNIGVIWHYHNVHSFFPIHLCNIYVYTVPPNSKSAQLYFHKRVN